MAGDELFGELPHQPRPQAAEDMGGAPRMREPTIKSRIEAMQITLQAGGPDVQRKFLVDQMKLWGPVVKEHNIKADS